MAIYADTLPTLNCKLHYRKYFFTCIFAAVAWNWWQIESKSWTYFIFFKMHENWNIISYRLYPAPTPRSHFLPTDFVFAFYLLLRFALLFNVCWLRWNVSMPNGRELIANECRTTGAYTTNAAGRGQTTAHTPHTHTRAHTAHSA